MELVNFDKNSHQEPHQERENIEQAAFQENAGGKWGASGSIAFKDMSLFKAMSVKDLRV